jgi:hypothetical protein
VALRKLCSSRSRKIIPKKIKYFESSSEEEEKPALVSTDAEDSADEEYILFATLPLRPLWRIVDSVHEVLMIRP